MTKTTEAIQHITAGELADDPATAIEEFDMAAALIDELAASLAQEREEAKGADGRKDENEPEEGEGRDEPEDETEAGVGATVTEKAGALKESVPTPLALAGLGIVAGLAALGAVKALSGRGGGAEGE